MTGPFQDQRVEGGLAGLRVVSFESRRRDEMGALIRHHGGKPLIAPAMREVPVQGNDELLDYLARLEGGKIDVVVLMTGVGLRTLVQSVVAEWGSERVAGALRKATLIARGPKPAAVLRALGISPDHTVPEPNTYRQILETIDAGVPVRDKVVAVQEYGIGNADFLRGLEARGARVERICIYRWALPEDLGPLREAQEKISGGGVDAALFTSATQVYHLFEVAGTAADRLRAGLRRIAVGSIGPVCSAALHDHGIEADFEPEHPKMGYLVRAAAQRARTVLRRKREEQS